MQNIGVTGIMCDTWWGVVEQQPGHYNFTAYQQLVCGVVGTHVLTKWQADMVSALGLKYQAVMSFHSVRMQCHVVMSYRPSAAGTWATIATSRCRSGCCPSVRATQTSGTRTSKAG